MAEPVLNEARYENDDELIVPEDSNKSHKEDMNADSFVYMNTCLVTLAWITLFVVTQLFKRLFSRQTHGQLAQTYVRQLATADLFSSVCASVTAWWLRNVVAKNDDVMETCVRLFSDHKWLVLLLLALVMGAFIIRYYLYYFVATGFLLGKNTGVGSNMKITDPSKLVPGDPFLLSGLIYVPFALSIFTFNVLYLVGALPESIFTPFSLDCVFAPNSITGFINRGIFMFCIIFGILISYPLMPQLFNRRSSPGLSDPVMTTDFVTTSLNSCCICWFAMVVCMWYLDLPSMIYVTMWSLFNVIDSMLLCLISLIMTCCMVKL